MSRKRCKRKVWALVNPLTHAMAGCAITSTADLDQLRMRELSAIESFRTGQATKDDWRSIADLLNIAETMARMGIGPEVLPVCERVQEALCASQARFQAGGSLGFVGPSLQAVRELAEYHDLQRTSVSRSTYEQAIKKTADRIKGAAADVKVLI